MTSNTVLVSCDMTSAYISHDGGKSWRMFNLRGVVEFFVFDPNDRNVIYAHATGLRRSSDNGETCGAIACFQTRRIRARCTLRHSEAECGTTHIRVKMGRLISRHRNCSQETDNRFWRLPKFAKGLHGFYFCSDTKRVATRASRKSEKSCAAF